jgi:hypothetical protein
MSINPAACAWAETGGIRRGALEALLGTLGRAGDVLALTGGVDEARGVDGLAVAGPSGADADVQPALAATSSSASIARRNTTIGPSSPNESCLYRQRPGRRHKKYAAADPTITARTAVGVNESGNAR